MSIAYRTVYFTAAGTFEVADIEDGVSVAIFSQKQISTVYTVGL